MTIPASAVVSVQPSVVSAGGNPLSLNGILLTNSTRVPIGSVLPFASADAVSAFFGQTTQEAALAANYYAGYQNSTKLPGTLYFAQFNQAAVSGYLRGGNLGAMTLTQLQALTGTVILTVGGTLFTSSSINLSAATSFSNAATIIQGAFTSPTFSVTFDSVSGAFVFTTTATGASATVTFATGTLSAGLLLTQATGATLSQGAAATAPAALMNSITGVTQNWVTFMTLVDPDGGSGSTVKQAFAAWVATKNNRFAYVAWDADATAVNANNTTCLGYVLTQNQTSGVILIGGDATYAASQGTTLAALLPPIAAFAMGTVASIDFGRTDGRITLAFRSQSGLAYTIADETKANNLKANGYNYYGAYATANQGFVFFYPGSITGVYKFADEFVNQVWMNSNFQLSLMTLLTTATSIPYNSQGYATIAQALKSDISSAKDFGAFRAGVALSSGQIAQVNSQAGQPIDTTLFNTGWYLQVKDPGATARANRQTPQCTFFYTDGGSVQQINLASINIQ